MAHEHPVGRDLPEARSGWHEPERGVDAQPLVPREEIRRGPHRLRDPDRPAVGIVEGVLPPAGNLEDGHEFEGGVLEERLGGGGRDVEVPCLGQQAFGKMDSDVVAPGERRRIAGVPAERDQHPGDVPEGVQRVIEPIHIHGIDEPHAPITHERVAGTGHRFLGIGDPTDTPGPVVHDTCVRCHGTRLDRRDCQCQLPRHKYLSTYAESTAVISSLAWLGLAISDPERANAFYEPLLGAPARVDGELRYAVGAGQLRLKPPGAHPRGGDHVHYAFSAGTSGYARAKETLGAAGPIEEHDLGVYTSVYAFDPDDHCVEVANRDAGDGAITELFEIVLEVEALARAEAWWDRFDPTLMDRGETRRRTRLDMGPFELELWEPQQGIADAAPGAHVDMGLRVDDLASARDALEDTGHARHELADGFSVRDPDGHRVALLEA